MLAAWRLPSSVGSSPCMVPQVGGFWAVPKSQNLLVWKVSGVRDRSGTVEARKLEHENDPTPKPKKAGRPAEIILHPRSKPSESTVKPGALRGISEMIASTWNLPVGALRRRRHIALNTN